MSATVEQLWQKYRQDSEKRDGYLERLDERTREYTGPKWGGDADPGNTDIALEATSFEYLSLVAPTLCFDNPRVRCTTSLPARMGDISKAMTTAVNKLCVDTEIARPLTDVAFDTLTVHGVGEIDFEEWFGVSADILHVGGHNKKGRPKRPVFRHKSPREYGFDSLAKKWLDRRYDWMVFMYPREELMERARTHPEEGWNVDAIKKARGDADLDMLGYDDKVRDLNRDMVVGVEFWMRNEQLPGYDREEGFNGTCRTVGVNGSLGRNGRPLQLRKPRGFFGPPDGPRQIFGIYPVLDDPFPLSPLTAMQIQSADVNAHAQAISTAAAGYKRLVFVDATDVDLVAKVKRCKTDWVVPINGMSKGGIVSVELGGASETQLGYMGLAKARLDRGLGINDALRGNVTGLGTARENEIAASSSSVRLGFADRRFVADTASALKRMAWYIYHSNQVAIPLGEDAASEMNMQGRQVMTAAGPVMVPPEPWFHGGLFWEATGLDFEFLGLTVEPYSMKRTDEATTAARMQMALQLAVEIAPVIPLNPHVRWKQLFQMIADANNWPEFSDLVDFDIAAKMAQLPAPLPSPQPRMTGDLGRPRSGGGGGGQAGLGRRAQPAAAPAAPKVAPVPMPAAQTAAKPGMAKKASTATK